MYIMWFFFDSFNCHSTCLAAEHSAELSCLTERTRRRLSPPATWTWWLRSHNSCTRLIGCGRGLATWTSRGSSHARAKPEVRVLGLSQTCQIPVWWRLPRLGIPSPLDLWTTAWGLVISKMMGFPQLRSGVVMVHLALQMAAPTVLRRAPGPRIAQWFEGRLDN